MARTSTTLFRCQTRVERAQHGSLPGESKPARQAPSVNGVANFYDRRAMQAPMAQAIAALLNCAIALGCGGKSAVRSEDDTASYRIDPANTTCTSRCATDADCAAPFAWTSSCLPTELHENADTGIVVNVCMPPMPW